VMIALMLAFFGAQQRARSCCGDRGAVPAQFDGDARKFAGSCGRSMPGGIMSCWRSGSISWPGSRAGSGDGSHCA
jgi:mevalonate pyrophosphate decarboxylase